MTTGPHHSSIRRLTSCGHGAAPWIIARRDETSYRARTSSGSASSRLNWVGTMWLYVTRCRSMSRSISSASNRSMSTAVCPSWIASVAKFSTAVWYSGEQHRCTWSSNGLMPKMPKNQVPAAGGSSGSAPVSGRRTPFGRPVVPDVYTIGAPAVRTSGRPAGSSAPSSASGAKPGTSPTPNRARPGTPAVSAADVATAANRSCATKAPAPESVSR
jgi:hypothetical protein